MKSQRSTSARKRGSSRRVVPLGILGCQKDEVNVPLLIGVLEPLECRIVLAKSGVHERHRIGRHIMFARMPFNARSTSSASFVRPDFARMYPRSDRFLLLAVKASAFPAL